MIAGVLNRYFGQRFIKTVISVFAGVFALIFTIDLVETLRRAGDSPQATGPLLATLSLFHTPTVAEQALPFAVLFKFNSALPKFVPCFGLRARTLFDHILVGTAKPTIFFEPVVFDIDIKHFRPRCA